MNDVIKVSVRSLAEYVFKSGSLVSGFKSASTFTEGSRIHREVQNTYHADDQSEVPLKTRLVYEDMLFIVEGRCDGLLFSGDKVTVDEIKSTSGSLDYIDESSVPVHWAQAECYAYLYLQESDLTDIQVQLTYVQKDSGEIKQFKRDRTREQLKRIFLHLIEMYAPYARLLREHELKRNASIKELEFPFEKYRQGQRRLAGAVYKTIIDGETLFASAPTGIGKTISTLFPSVKAIGESHLQKLFYLTAKTTTRQTGEEAFEKMKAKGLVMHVVTITAKDKVCFNQDGHCASGNCEFAEGYYDRINGAMLDILTQETSLAQGNIEKYALKHKVCPFEFSLDLAYCADAVICDYNYIFDPKVSLKRLFDEQKKQTVLLVDEAHNLVDRGRDMFSAQLAKSPFLMLKREYKGKNKLLADASKKINETFISIRKQAENMKAFVLDEDVPNLNDLVSSFCEHAEKELLTGGENAGLLLETYFSARDWIRINRMFDERYILYAEIVKNEVMVKQFCVDPSYLLRHAGKGFKARVFFSATLSPMHYFREMLGGTEENYFARIPSPFSDTQTDVYIQPVSTRFHDRERSIAPILSTMVKTVRSKPGNYLIFFPSYKYLNVVLEQWAVMAPEIRTIFQGSGMVEADRSLFLDAFQAGNKDALVGFAVLGGVFSEGIDLEGDRLNGVMVVGVGLPQIGFERDLIKQHFTRSAKNGYDYAYVYPGMNKVLQAGGRLIRSETDHGTITLMDDRFLQHKYQSMLPEEWKNFTLI